MPRGGKRSGAGRKKGALTKKTQEIAAKASSEGITPLEVMLENMRFAHHQADAVLAKIAGNPGADVRDIKALLELRQVAEECAKDAAPYVHPRLQSIQHGGEGGGPIEVARIERVIVYPANTDANSLRPTPPAKALPRR